MITATCDAETRDQENHVREYAQPPLQPVPTSGNLTDDVVNNAREYADAVVFSRRSGTAWVDVTASEFHDEVIAVAKGFIAAGVERGDRVAIISSTRYEWTVLDYAIWFAGAASVPIYETSAPDQIAWILADAGVVLAFAETADHEERIAKNRSELPGLANVVGIDAGDLDGFIARGSGISNAVLEHRRTDIGPKDLATLIYTSGTTGRPKGCELTHANFMFELGVAVAILDELFDADRSSTLLFLPLAHVFARIIEIGCVKRRVRIGHSSDVKNLLDDLAAFKPTFILAVPRVFEKVFNTASQRAAAAGKGKIFDAAAVVAIAHSRALDRSGPGPLLRLRHALFRRLVYAKLLAALGGETRYAVSGGAPLGERLAHFYRGIGLPVLEGYGLTETTGALTVNLPDDQRIGTVGRPFPGTSVRVDDDGELLFRGGQVFRGYWNEPAATASALADGWFRTGDVGEVDDDGFVRITGRKKEILVTAGGKNVAPTVLEDRIRAHALISQCLVVGDGKPFVAALVTLDEEALATWTETKGKSGNAAQLATDPDVLAAVQEAIDDANAAVSQAESVRKFKILPRDWAEETGELTPTLKVKRAIVMQRHHLDIESLYL
jgi:long-chain acyl-CoA synthetase